MISVNMLHVLCPCSFSCVWYVVSVRVAVTMCVAMKSGQDLCVSHGLCQFGFLCDFFGFAVWHCSV